MILTTKQVMARIRAYQEGFAAGASRATRRGRTHLIADGTAAIWERGYHDGVAALGAASKKFLDHMVDNPTLPGIPA